MADHATVLSVHNLSVNFGGLKALNGVNLELRRGEVLGLIDQMALGRPQFLMRSVELSHQLKVHSNYLESPLTGLSRTNSLVAESRALCKELDSFQISQLQITS